MIMCHIDQVVKLVGTTTVFTLLLGEVGWSFLQERGASLPLAALAPPVLPKGCRIVPMPPRKRDELSSREDGVSQGEGPQWDETAAVDLPGDCWRMAACDALTS